MKNFKHLKTNKVLIQFSDGSASYLFLHIHKKELNLEIKEKEDLTYQ